MGRRHTVSSLPADKQTAVLDCIRAYRYLTLDGMLAELEKHGLAGIISRSALHRFLPELDKRDALRANPDEGTIITIVERGTGEVRTVKSSASGAAIEEMIVKLTLLDPVS